MGMRTHLRMYIRKQMHLQMCRRMGTTRPQHKEAVVVAHHRHLRVPTEHVLAFGTIPYKTWGSFSLASFELAEQLLSGEL